MRLLLLFQLRSMRREGVEPSRTNVPRILSPMRLPIPPSTLIKIPSNEGRQPYSCHMSHIVFRTTEEYGGKDRVNQVNSKQT